MVFALPDQAPTDEHFVDIGQCRLAVADSGGDGDIVVLCHPASQSAAIWGYQQPVLVAAGYRVIAYSRRGYGVSEKGSADAPGTSVADLVAVLDNLSARRVHIIGAAAGGITALAFAISQPDRTLSVMLAGTIFSVNENSWRDAFGRLGIAAVRDSVSTEFLELGPTYRFSSPDGAAHFAALSAEAHRQAPTRQPSGVNVTWDTLRQLQRPVFLLTGEADLYAPPPLQAMIATYLPNAETHTLREVGHAAYWEQPAAFNDIVLAFLARHRQVSNA